MVSCTGIKSEARTSWKPNPRIGTEIGNELARGRTVLPLLLLILLPCRVSIAIIDHHVLRPERNSGNSSGGNDAASRLFVVVVVISTIQYVYSSLFFLSFQ